MKLFYTNDETDRKIKDIRQKIHLSMNGIVSEQMTKQGIKYKKNYGVSVPRLIEIAKTYTHDHNLAQQLFSLKIRETMILAALLEPVNKLTPDAAKVWINEIDQSEIMELSSMYLFSKLPYSNVLCIECILSDSLWQQITGFTTGARIVDLFSDNEIFTLIKRAVELSETSEFLLFKSISLFLSRLCRKNKEIALLISEKTGNFPNSKYEGQLFIVRALKQEIIFLNLI